MSGPAFVVLPITAEQDTGEIASTLKQSLYEKTHPEEYQKSEHTGPLKQATDSLFKYISWEDPIRTLGSYIGAMSVLFGAYYLPLTDMVLKAGLTTFGVVSVAEFASRSFGPNSLSTRLRPKEYKKVPEPTLNATLKDIHDLIQYTVVQAQRIIFGQDLEKTFAAFLGFTALYWLIQIVSPFWLAVIGLTSLYIVPLVASPRGRSMAHDASVRAEELANAAVESGKGLTQNGKVMAGELSSKARQATLDTGERIQNMAQSGKQTAGDLSSKARQATLDTGERIQNIAQSGKQTAGDLSSKARQTTLDTGERIQNMAQSGKQTAADLSARASGTASDISGAAAENVRELPQMGTSAIHKAPGNANSALSGAKQYISSFLPAGTDGNSEGNRSIAGGAANKASQLSNSAAGSARQMPPENNAAKQSASDHSETMASSWPGQTNGEKIGSVADRVSTYASARDVDAKHGIMDRSRGAALPEGCYIMPQEESVGV